MPPSSEQPGMQATREMLRIAEYLRTAVTDGRLGGSIQIGQFWSLARMVRGVPYGGCRRPGHRAGRRGCRPRWCREGVKPARRWPAGGRHRRRCSPARAPGYGSSARRRGFPPGRDGVVTAAQNEGAAAVVWPQRLAPGGELGASRHSQFSDVAEVGLAVDVTTSSGATDVNDGTSQIPRGGLRRCIGAG
jgi:hypothetical protein